MHSLLERQLKKTGVNIAGQSGEFQQLLTLVDAVYRQSDEDRRRIERSMEINSRELMLRNDQIAAAERKYREIFDNVSEGIFQAAPDGTFISVNPAMAALCGSLHADQLKMTITNIGTDLYADPQRHIQIIKELTLHGSISNWESEIRRPDGSILWISESTRCVYDSGGELKYYEGVMRDIQARKTAETERQQMQERLSAVARQAGMAEIATGVLHNVGNVLNSVNVSASLCAERAKSSRLPGLAKAIGLLEEHKTDLAAFLTEHEKGRQLVEYLARLNEQLRHEQCELLNELTSLVQNIEHVKQIVRSQQTYARTAVVHEKVPISEIVDDAVRINQESLERHRVTVVRELSTLPPLTIDKHQVLQILVNLISNAKHAMRGTPGERIMTISAFLRPDDSSRLILRVADTGMGIKPEDLTRIFSMGFTTRVDGHGFGLHTSALAAQTMGGSLTAQSAGLEKGATFNLEIPITAEDQAVEAGKAA
jgi:PAS domain S-box-containing protein